MPAAPLLGASVYFSATATAIQGELTDLATGGAAPFSEQFNASMTLAPGDGLTSAIYRFSVGAPVPAVIQTYATNWWANASVIFPRPGLYQVYLYLQDTVGQAMPILYTTVFVSTGPAPLLSIRQTPGPDWVNASIGFLANVSGGSGSYAYNWSFGNGATSTAAMVNESYLLPGTYLVEVAVNDLIWGGSATATALVAVHAAPTVGIAEESTASDSTYRFVAIVDGGLGNMTFTWLFGDGTSASGAQVEHTWPGPGNYTVELEAHDVYGHTAIASIYSVVPTVPTTTSGSGATAGLEELVGALVVLVIALAIVAALLFVRSRRPPESPPEETAGPVGEAPQYVEEIPTPDGGDGAPAPE